MGEKREEKGKIKCDFQFSGLNSGVENIITVMGKTGEGAVSRLG